MAGLQAQGIAPLTDAELRAQIVGKSKRLRTRLTGEEGTAFYSEDGKHADDGGDVRRVPRRRDHGHQFLRDPGWPAALLVR